ncbi:MAG: AAA family ATPase [Deltaproteobacteria bacterium]|nr:AAA family ATPase [Deltaproteobacteria bacterium]
MIDSVTLQNFKAHRDTRVPLGRMTVLVGQNAVGKTSVLQAMSLLGRCLSSPTTELFAGRFALPGVVHQGATDPLLIELDGTLGTGRRRVGLRAPAGRTPSDAAGVPATLIDGDPVLPESIDPGADTSQLSGHTLLLCGIQRREVAALRPQVESLLLRLDEARLAEPSYVEDEHPRMQGDGFGLATVLSELKRTDTARFQAFERAVQEVVPTFRSLGFKRTIVQSTVPRVMSVDGQRVLVNESNRVVADEILLTFADAATLPASAASEGTLVTIGMLAAIYAEPRPRVLLVDDIDRALHPFAQRSLIEALRRALEVAPDVQVVATTHSPYLVDALAAEEVVVLGRSTGGPVRAMRLSEHPARRHLESLTTGEFWSAEGESWVAAP